jgi:hypothetical protein
MIPIVSLRPLRAASSRLLPVALATLLVACADDPGKELPPALAAVPGSVVEPEAADRATKAPVLARRYDVNGDGREDLVWATANGEQQRWLMNGASAATVQPTTVNALNPFTYSVRSVLGVQPSVPFAQQCVDPVLLLADGTLRVLNQSTDGGSCTLTNQRDFKPPGWNLVSTEGDYDNVFNNEIVWRNAVGTVAIWGLDATLNIEAAGFPATAPLEWSIVDARGDYDGDQRSDILWRNSAGTVAMWRMTGLSAIAGATFFGTAPPGTWTLVDGSGDYDGDRKSDLLWISTSGQVVIWFLNTTAGTFTAASVGTLSAGSTILEGNSDVDGDGRSDLIVRRGDSILVALMNGGAVKASGTVGTLGPEWRLVTRNVR